MCNGLYAGSLTGMIYRIYMIRFLITILIYSMFIIACTNQTTKSENEIDTVVNPINPSLALNTVFDTLKHIEENQENGEYWQISKYNLEPQDLNFIPPSELRIIRNEIFA